MAKFKVKVKDSKFTKGVYNFVRLFKKKNKIINLNEEPLPKRYIMIANHNSANGPLTYRTILPQFFMTWGAHQMTEGFISRWKYLYYIYYQKKLGWKKFSAFVMATLFGLFAGIFYKFAKIIPIYYDMRVKNTFKYSLDCLEKDVPILIFPEDSSHGYKESIGNFASGYLMVSKLYYKKYGVDLPVYPVYFNGNKHRILIGKPFYCHELAKEHSQEEILKLSADKVNELNDLIKSDEYESIAKTHDECLSSVIKKQETSKA